MPHSPIQLYKHFPSLLTKWFPTFTQIYTPIDASATWGLVSCPRIVRQLDWRLEQAGIEPSRLWLVYSPHNVQWSHGNIQKVCMQEFLFNRFVLPKEYTQCHFWVQKTPLHCLFDVIKYPRVIEKNNLELLLELNK